ncbi:hypothetical protein BDM02DRAFT_2210866 [Thelephora ganbajun]|uniref:Uncharacterized protein n=1 Tax=Thelephora ganbajun TaxID=370292 RepID=A0ACB6YZG1_THEGA|nr:hypothetical protein BDM02DRAFT_2210866 [Thelephora ganbajun]
MPWFEVTGSIFLSVRSALIEIRDSSLQNDVCYMPFQWRNRVFSSLPVTLLGGCLRRTGMGLVPRVIVLMYSALKVFSIRMLEFSARLDKVQGWIFISKCGRVFVLWFFALIRTYFANKCI